MTNAFEYGDALLTDNEDGEGKPDAGSAPQRRGSNTPYLNLATFRMVVLADEVLESFFETDLSASFRLEPAPDVDLPASSSGLLGDIWSNIATVDNKKIFHKFTDEIGKTIGKHQVIHRPSIGRYTTLDEPKAHESIVTPSMRKSPSKSSFTTTGSTTSVTTSTLSIDSKSLPPRPSEFSPLPMVKAANAALMERSHFAIDDATGDDDETDDESERGADDDQVMDEVDAFLEAHDSGLTAADKEVANDLLHAKPVK
jgi:hypothetical protein